jgi:hypothetical protein
MTHGTLPDALLEVEGDDGGPQPRRGRTGLKIAVAAIILALTAGGAYAVINAGSSEQPDTTAVTKSGPVAKADTAATDKAADKPVQAKPAAKAEKPKPKLPSAKNMTTAQKRAALIAYLKQGGFPLTEESSPATAAKGACTLLDGGMKSEKLITELSRGAGVDVDMGRYFLVGATHFYCAQYSVKA